MISDNDSLTFVGLEILVIIRIAYHSDYNSDYDDDDYVEYR